MKIDKKKFGKTTGGEAVDVYTLSNGGTELRLITYGGRWLSLNISGNDIALGAPDLEGYQDMSPERNVYFGALIGRCGNRIGNARFEINGTTYTVTPNIAPHTLHGGKYGFDKKVWTADTVEGRLKLSLLSPDGDEGYPGNLHAEVYHYINAAGAIELEFVATSDKDTICNLTQHNYFNLEGHNSGDVLGHQLTVYADFVTEIGEGLIPNGKLIEVAGTAYDFNTAKAIGRDIADPMLQSVRGYDVNFVIRRDGGEALQKAAEVFAPKSGIRMEVWTTKPSIQLYTGNYFENLPAKGGQTYEQYAGFALETQYAPDSINHKGKAGFDDAALKKGKVYRHKTEFRFK